MPINRDTPVWQLTVGEIMDLIESQKPKVEIVQQDKKYEYGIDGLARVFGCSKKTAWTIKNSGKIDKAITQIGRTIVIDIELALYLGFSALLRPFVHAIEFVLIALGPRPRENTVFEPVKILSAGADLVCGVGSYQPVSVAPASTAAAAATTRSTNA